MSTNEPLAATSPPPVVASPAAAAPADPWAALRQHTPARIALGRTGAALPVAEQLRLAAAHAQARDAVHQPLDVAALEAALQADGWAVQAVHSQAPDRASYLRRPDLGRRLDAASLAALDARAQAMAAATGSPAGTTRNAGGTSGTAAPAADLALVVADGLSALAAQRHAVPLLAALRQRLQADGGPPLVTTPVVLARQARVALADAVGERLGARAVLILLGERPGLSSADSLGAYLTFAPRIGRTDAERNCVSNIRPEGLPLAEAARRIAWLLRASLRRGLSGVALKDGSDTPALTGADDGA